MNKKFELNLKKINYEVSEFRIIEELTMQLALENYESAFVLKNVVTKSGMQRLGYICDVADNLNKSVNAPENINLLKVKDIAQIWRNNNLTYSNPVYFTKNHDISSLIERTEESLKWNLISSFNSQEIAKKYKEKYKI